MSQNGCTLLQVFTWYTYALDMYDDKAVLYDRFTVTAASGET